MVKKYPPYHLNTILPSLKHLCKFIHGYGLVPASNFITGRMGGVSAVLEATLCSCCLTWTNSRLHIWDAEYAGSTSHIITPIVRAPPSRWLAALDGTGKIAVMGSVGVLACIEFGMAVADDVWHRESFHERPIDQQHSTLLLIGAT